MSQLYGKQTHDIPIRRLPSLRTGVTIIWLETTASLSKERDEKVDRLCASNNCHIFRYTTVSKCRKYLKLAKPYERIIITMIIDNSSITPSDISQLSQFRQIGSVLLVNLLNNKDNDIDTKFPSYTRDKIDKISVLFHDYEPLFDQLQQLLCEANEFDDDIFSFYNRPEKALRDLHAELGSYIWSQAFKVILKDMDYNSSEAKREMLTECRRCCYNDSHSLAMIDAFNRTYRPADAILWYTKPCFLYRLINKALRTGDNFVLYKFRYFIVALYTRIKETSMATIHHKEPFRVYRGSKLSRDEVETLQIGSLVATKAFFSSSRYLDVAQCFICIDPSTDVSPSRSRDDQCQYILFEIDVDMNNSPDIVFTDVSDQSAISDENEILFNLGTTFIITGIHYDEEHYIWHIRMITSSGVSQLSGQYNTYTSDRCTETTAAISFGHLTCDIFSNYPKAVSHLQRLLRSKMLKDEKRPEAYFFLARAYCAMGKYEQAIMSCRCAQLLLRRRLPELNMIYARTLSCLSIIYLEMGNLAQATYFLERASTIYHRSLPKYHFAFAFYYNDLANLYWQCGQYESALDLLTSTLAYIKRVLPPSYPCEAQTLHIMGLVQYSLNNREHALNYFKQSLEMRQNFHADDHPSVARTCYELSKLYEEKGNYSTALDYAQRSLNIRKAKLPRSHKELKQSVELVERLLLQKNTLSSAQ